MHRYLRPALQLRGHLGRQSSDLLLALQGLLMENMASNEGIPSNAHDHGIVCPEPLCRITEPAS